MKFVNAFKFFWSLLSPATQWTLIGLLYLVLGVIIWRTFAP